MIDFVFNIKFLIIIILILGTATYLYYDAKKNSNATKKEDKKEDKTTVRNSDNIKPENKIDFKTNNEFLIEQMMDKLDDLPTKSQKEINQLNSNFFADVINTSQKINSNNSSNKAVLLSDKEVEEISGILDLKLGSEITPFVKRVDKDGSINLSMEAVRFITGEHIPLITPQGTIRVINFLSVEDEFMLALETKKPILLYNKQQKNIRQLTAEEVQLLTANEDEIELHKRLQEKENQLEELLKRNRYLEESTEKLKENIITYKAQAELLKNITQTSPVSTIKCSNKNETNTIIEVPEKKENINENILSNSIIEDEKNSSNDKTFNIADKEKVFTENNNSIENKSENFNLQNIKDKETENKNNIKPENDISNNISVELNNESKNNSAPKNEEESADDSMNDIAVEIEKIKEEKLNDKTEIKVTTRVQNKNYNIPENPFLPLDNLKIEKEETQVKEENIKEKIINERNAKKIKEDFFIDTILRDTNNKELEPNKLTYISWSEVNFTGITTIKFALKRTKEKLQQYLKENNYKNSDSDIDTLFKLLNVVIVDSAYFVKNKNEEVIKSKLITIEIKNDELIGIKLPKEETNGYSGGYSLDNYRSLKERVKSNRTRGTINKTIEKIENNEYIDLDAKENEK